MAEGLLNSIYGSNYKAYSAGIKPTKVNPYDVKVMKEIGIDISKYYSKRIEDYKREIFDFIVTVCDNAKETWPFFPGKKIIHKSFENPANFNGSNEETLDFFRKIRDEIKTWIVETFSEDNA